MTSARRMTPCAVLLSALAPIAVSGRASNSETATVPIDDAQEHVEVTQISPQVLVFATSSGNVLASVGPDGALLIGTPSITSTPQISEMLAKRTKSPVRYVVIAPQDPAQSQADAGWGKLGAFVIMHENALQRIGGHAMGSPSALPERLVKLGVDRPHVAFSEVVTFDMNGDSVHIIHQKPGYSDADSVVHFHVAKVVYLGEVFPGDGYPMIDAAQDGSLNGVVDMLSWTDKTFHIVPARGAVATGADVKEFRTMLVTLRDRVNALVKEGRTEDQIVAAHHSAGFDARWGHGHVSPDAFVRELYRAAKEPKATPPERKN
jgi:cyclase